MRVGISAASSGFDGSMTIWHHALCDVLKRPAQFLRASATSNEVPQPIRAPLDAIANTLRARKLKQVVWRHPIEPSCLLEFADDYYALFTSVGLQPVIVRGALDEVVASVPDEDFSSVVDTVIATGKTLAPERPSPVVRFSVGSAGFGAGARR